MIFSEQEKQAFSKIVALSSKDQGTVRDVLFAILTYATIDAFNQEENEIIIPYLCSLKLKYIEQVNEKGIESNINITAEPSVILLREFVSIKNNEEHTTKKYYKRQIRLYFKNLLKIDIEE